MLIIFKTTAYIFLGESVVKPTAITYVHFYKVLSLSICDCKFQLFCDFVIYSRYQTFGADSQQRHESFLRTVLFSSGEATKLCAA